MCRRLWFLLPVLLLLSGLGIRPPEGARAGSRPAESPTCFTPSPGPNPSNTSNTLAAVAVVSASDVWAVGYAGDGDAITSLTAHWDGRNWTQIPSPNPGHRNILSGVYAVGAAEAWAVGNADSDALLLHYQAGTWTPMPGPGTGLLNAVRGTAGNDVWAVGEVDAATAQALILHWDGTNWSRSPVPVLDNNSVLYGVSPRAPDDAWAVGTTWAGSGYSTLLLHWDGSTWSQIPSPDPGTSGSLYSSAAVSAHDVWAVGSTGSQTLTLHWDGTSWRQVASPNPGNLGNILYGVSATGAGEVWSAGQMDTPDGPQTLILQWDGTTWRQSASPNPSGTVNILNGIAAISADDVWAVGYLAQGTAPNTLILHSCAAPPATATATPGVTVTPCELTFTDVHPADYFYEPVQYLACRGVISGYGDGTFRPYNGTTRSQMVKIVVLGFGRAITTPSAGSYTFADVLPTNPFFAVVETAAAGGVVSGYRCGGPDEPCDDRQRPYFRPYANVTRSQLAKIDVVAAGWPLLNPTGPTFVDLGPGSPFYPFVETAVCHDVISGYGDHTFHPGASATRGQIAKIVSLSITNNGTCSAAAAR
jgi:hypothetical protein